jgi:hypothetical protein
MTMAARAAGIILLHHSIVLCLDKNSADWGMLPITSLSEIRYFNFSDEAVIPALPYQASRRQR